MYVPSLRGHMTCMWLLYKYDVIFSPYIQGYGHTNVYIAAQGPMPNTIGDFWRMIWEHRLSTIVMLTKVTEGGKVWHVINTEFLYFFLCVCCFQRKCEQYWPNNVHETYNPPETTLLVSFEEVQPFADYEIKTLVVTNVSQTNEQTDEV